MAITISLMTRRACNPEILDATLAHYDRLMNTDGNGENFRFSSDIHNDPTIGGAGFCLHMDFQCQFILWSILVLVAWLIFATQFTDPDPDEPEGFWTKFGLTLTSKGFLSNCLIQNLIQIFYPMLYNVNAA